MNLDLSETKSTLLKKSTSVKFNNLSLTKPLSKEAKRSSEKNIEHHIEEVGKKSSDSNTKDEKLSVVTNKRSFEKFAKQSSDDTTGKSPEAVKKWFDRVIKKSSDCLSKTPSEKLVTKSSGEVAKFSQRISVNNSIEKVVYPATGMKNSESLMNDNDDVKKSNSSFRDLNTPTGIILGLVIALAIALWYGIHNGRFKAFLTPALRGYDSESSSAYDDASLRYHDILPFDAEPYDDPTNRTE